MNLKGTEQWLRNFREKNLDDVNKHRVQEWFAAEDIALKIIENRKEE